MSSPPSHQRAAESPGDRVMTRRDCVELMNVGPGIDILEELAGEIAILDRRAAPPLGDRSRNREPGWDALPMPPECSSRGDSRTGASKRASPQIAKGAHPLAVGRPAPTGGAGGPAFRSCRTHRGACSQPDSRDLQPRVAVARRRSSHRRRTPASLPDRTRRATTARPRASFSSAWKRGKSHSSATWVGAGRAPDLRDFYNRMSRPEPEDHRGAPRHRESSGGAPIAVANHVPTHDRCP